LGEIRAMNKEIRVLIILAVFLLICPALGLADIVYIKNGDKLFGTIQEYRTPFSQFGPPMAKSALKMNF
jgi:hypothetical protein